MKEPSAGEIFPGPLSEEVVEARVYPSLTTSQDWKGLTSSVILRAQVGFPAGAVVKNPLASEGSVSLIPGFRRCPGEGNGNPLQYSCLENHMDRGAWWATVHGVTKESDTT